MCYEANSAGADLPGKICPDPSAAPGKELHILAEAECGEARHREPTGPEKRGRPQWTGRIELPIFVKEFAGRFKVLSNMTA
jgi:hypothetical protein